LIFSLFALALAAAPVPDAGGCALQQLAACPDVRALVQEQPFQDELKRFVGNRQTGYLIEKGRASDEAMMALGGPAEPVQRLGDLYLFTACRERSCEEKGAVALQPDGQFVAVAILHTSCAKLFPAKDCFLRDTLSILTNKDGAAQAAIDGLSDWARREVMASNDLPGAPTMRLERVELVEAAGATAVVEAEPKAARPAKPKKASRPAPTIKLQPLIATEAPRPDAPAPETRPEVAPPAPTPAPAVQAEQVPAAPAATPTPAPVAQAAPPLPPVRTPAPQVPAPAAEPPPPPTPTSLSGAEVYAVRTRPILPPLPAAPLPVSTAPTPPALLPPPVPKKPKKPVDWWKWNWTPYGY
jgi:hypothetical protein